MTIREFLNKWGYQSAVGYGSAQFDCRESLNKDLNNLMEESFLAGVRLGYQNGVSGTCYEEEDKLKYSKYSEYIKTLK